MVENGDLHRNSSTNVCFMCYIETVTLMATPRGDAFHTVIVPQWFWAIAIAIEKSSTVLPPVPL